ncbi:putative inactive poly [ADP-ribose] polymerase SRO2 [Apium graveolens]|uniref:putative inactive poly [ADP-ribose] polymerase SRO2 n=1 Tax=Apium graveolens TaxID=4045 RepID=UPI003D799D64
MNSSIVLNNRKRKIVHPPRESSSFHVQSLLHNYSNFKSSGDVSRLMYYDGFNWVDYDQKVVEAVRVCWNCTVEVEIEDVLCLFDFYRMLVIDFVSHVEKSVAWIDVDGHCFFPKFVIDDFSGFRDYDGLRIEATVSGGGELVNKRKREGDEVKRNVIKKKTKVVSEEIESLRWNKARAMREGERAYLVAKNLFSNWAGIRGIEPQISGIYRVTRNTILDRARYDGFMKQVEITKAARGDANVTLAWIKCSSDDVERFLDHGFSCPSKASLGEAFGFGIYLSPIKLNQACVMMPQDAGENYVMLCRVILGKCEKVQAGSQQLYPSSREFDTGVDDVRNPKWYIVWGANMNTHILPECVVSYKHTRNVSSQLSGTLWLGQSSAKPNLTWMPKVSDAMTARFFAKLLSSLPASKSSKLRRLCCTYKTGKVPKAIFMKILRSVVGDQVLRTAIQEVRGKV